METMKQLVILPMVMVSMMLIGGCGGDCGTPACLDDGQPCTSDEQCCESSLDGIAPPDRFNVRPVCARNALNHCGTAYDVAGPDGATWTCVVVAGDPFCYRAP